MSAEYIVYSSLLMATVSKGWRPFLAEEEIREKILC